MSTVIYFGVHSGGPDRKRAKEKTVPSEDQVEVVQIAASLGWDRSSRPTSRAQWAAYVYELVAETGLRPSEVLKLRLEEFDRERLRYGSVSITRRGADLLEMLSTLGAWDKAIPISSDELGTQVILAQRRTGLSHASLSWARNCSQTRFASANLALPR